MPNRTSIINVFTVCLVDTYVVEIAPLTEKKERPTQQSKVCCSKKDNNSKRAQKETKYYVQTVMLHGALCVLKYAIHRNINKMNKFDTIVIFMFSGILSD